MLWLRCRAGRRAQSEDSLRGPGSRGSGLRPSNPVCRRRISRMVSAKTLAPPTLSSSRFTLVTTANFSPSSATASATRRGSSKSIGCGRPLGTAQKPQRRVQRFPSNIKVAVRWFQHSPMFGQWADSQTVFRLSPRASFFNSWYCSPMGALARSQRGLRAGALETVWIWISSVVAIGLSGLDAVADVGDSKMNELGLIITPAMHHA